MANKITNTDHYAAIANAIRSKNGETDTYTPAEMADAIGRIPKGVVEENDVIFIDYDGTIVKSYTASEFQNLQTLPSNPNHIDEGLIGQGWNWALVDAKEYVSKYGMLEIGQMYITSDGKTHAHISIPEIWPDYMVPVKFSHSDSAGETIINWGDGTPAETASGSTINISHVYSTYGDYKITFETTSGEMVISPGTSSAGDSHFIGTGAGGILLKRLFVGYNTVFGNGALQYCCGLESLTLPQHIDDQSFLNNSVFSVCSSLKCVTIPNLVTSVNFSFSSCESLEYVSIPASVTQLTSTTFRYCTNLKRVSIPENVTSLPTYFAQECYNLRRISHINVDALPPYSFASANLRNVRLGNRLTSIRQAALSNNTTLLEIRIPESVTEIQQNAFYNCYSVIEYHVEPTTPPTLGNNVFQAIGNTTKIFVPAGSLNAYKNANKWSTYANRMVAEPE